MVAPGGLPYSLDVPTGLLPPGFRSLTGRPRLGACWELLKVERHVITVSDRNSKPATPELIEWDQRYVIFGEFDQVVRRAVTPHQNTSPSGKAREPVGVRTVPIAGHDPAWRELIEQVLPDDTALVRHDAVPKPAPHERHGTRRDFDLNFLGARLVRMVTLKVLVRPCPSFVDTGLCGLVKVRGLV